MCNDTMKGTMSRMTVTIDVSEEAENVIRENGVDVQQFATYAVEDTIRRLLQGHEDATQHHNWWASLSQKEKEDELAIFRQSLADIDAGRVRPASEVFARLSQQSRKQSSSLS
jgi:predicted transcriptional regulator